MDDRFRHKAVIHELMLNGSSPILIQSDAIPPSRLQPVSAAWHKMSCLEIYGPIDEGK